MPRLLNALSIDLEDWFHAELVRPHVAHTWPQRRVEWAAAPILQLLERYEVKATFFVVGDVVEHHPDLVRALYEAGHEIGCHGWSHRMLWTLEPDLFAEDMDRFDRAAEDVMPLNEIIGYRAPSFSLEERSAWAIDLLLERGYRYDSSIYPVRTPLYGLPGAPDRPYQLGAGDLRRDAEGSEVLVEFPMTAWSLLGTAIPISGGTYMRFLPQRLWRAMLNKVNQEGRPFVIYAHPWEMDGGTPRVDKLSLGERMITYYGIESALQKLEMLLQTFRLAPLRTVLRLPHERVERVAS